jgi:hypothetical protein
MASEIPSDSNTGRTTLLLLLFLGMGAIAASIGAIAIQASHGPAIVKHMIWHPPHNDSGSGGSHPRHGGHASGLAMARSQRSMRRAAADGAIAKSDPPPSLVEIRRLYLEPHLDSAKAGQQPDLSVQEGRTLMAEQDTVAQQASGAGERPHRHHRLQGQHHSPLLGVCEELISKLDVAKVDSLRDEMQV